MVITKTPMRISFAGGGTDLAEFYSKGYGSVVAAAINKFVYVIVKERHDHSFRILASDLQIAESVKDISEPVIRAAVEKVGVTQGTEIAVMSDLEAYNTGLGFSSSMTIGLLNALYAYKGNYANAETLARDACDIEIKQLNRPGGKQNQYMAAYGGLRHLIFHPDETVGSIRIELNPNHKNRLLDSLLLFRMDYAGQSDTIMQEQRRMTAKNVQVLTTMMNQADDLAKYLKVGAVASLGQTLRENWACKKTLARGISNPQIDSLVESAISAGAIGAKVTGIGGGGFLLVCVPPEKRSDVRKKMSGLQEVPITFSEHGSDIIFNAR